ncbi:hypothetical protein X797_000869 [Metarhizium robertsii]|uniref:Uncharacterized protein n=1 Tax=Metarhizium robertsii TaxID=568076 RepID=A0A0A1V7C5_9HYPO|nr:hypothetical protein X797_000869 [Metarhizium robertsii]
MSLVVSEQDSILARAGEGNFTPSDWFTITSPTCTPDRDHGLNRLAGVFQRGSSAAAPTCLIITKYQLDTRLHQEVGVVQVVGSWPLRCQEPALVACGIVAEHQHDLPTPLSGERR